MMKKKIWDENNIISIDNGGYQGTLLFMIPRNTYQPNEGDYLLTYVSYGSCSGCDTLMSIRRIMDDENKRETVIKDFMTLSLHLIENMIKPFESWWEDEDIYDD